MAKIGERAKKLSAGILQVARKPCGDFSYHMHYLKCSSQPRIVLNGEHTEYRWLSYDETADFPMMSGAIEALDSLKIGIRFDKYPSEPYAP